MRRKDKEITDPEAIREIMEKAEICRLGLVEDGEAYIVPVNYAFHNNTIYIHSAMQGRKIEIIKKNDKAVFEMESYANIETGPRPCDWTAKYRSVMGKGKISIEKNPEEKKIALDLIMKKYGWGTGELTYDDALLSRLCILKIQVESAIGKQSGNWE